MLFGGGTLEASSSGTVAGHWSYCSAGQAAIRPEGTRVIGPLPIPCSGPGLGSGSGSGGAVGGSASPRYNTSSCGSATLYGVAGLVVAALKGQLGQDEFTR